MQAEIAIIGGSGLYDAELIEDTKQAKAYTPFGKTSDFITIGNFKGRKVAFLPRHGKGHTIPPHKINCRANIWALKELGVTRILAVNSCGSLQEKFKAGDIVIIDQFVDRTKNRPSTFYEEGKICHITVADPFCEELRKPLIEEGRKLKIPIHETGTYVCVEGPRFSTRAESKLFKQWGIDVVGMTLLPDCILAREAQICYASVALVTDYDVWAEKPVVYDEILQTMKKNVDKAKKLIFAAIPKIPFERKCFCKDALKNALI